MAVKTQEGDVGNNNNSQEESETQMTDAFGSLPADDSQQREDEKEEEEEEEEGGEQEEEEPKKTGKGAKRKSKKGPATPIQKKKKAAKVEVEICTERDQLKRRPLPSDARASNSFTVLSWNVNGLRATVKNGLAVLRRMVETERPDLVCFQETKLQEKDVEGLVEQNILPGYTSAWSCSTTKKGYAGTAVFFTKQAEAWQGGGEHEADKESASAAPAKKKQKQGKISTFFGSKKDDTGKSAKAAAAATEAPAATEEDAKEEAALPGGRSGMKVLGVRFGIGNPKHDGEGRSITVEYEKFFMVTLYVPNSGQKLERLPYRTKEWDVALKAYVEALEAEGKPVAVNGDLNVAHLDLDIYNSGAKHIVKNAGTTKEERESFDSWMKEGKVADAFRRLHPDAKGAYTYWSVRTNARPVNKGLRLDYFVCSKALFDGTLLSAGESKAAGKKKKQTRSSVAVHDCFQLDAATVGLSDHCPIGLVLRTT